MRRGAGTLEMLVPFGMQTERRRCSRAVGVRRGPDSGQRAHCWGRRHAAARAMSFGANGNVKLDSVDRRMVALGLGRPVK
jgi:hypothetical protein